MYLTHENLNFDLSIKANQIKNYKSFKNLILKSEIKEGLIDFDKTKFSWSNYVDFEISDSLLSVSYTHLTLPTTPYV